MSRDPNDTCRFCDRGAARRVRGQQRRAASRRRVRSSLVPAISPGSRWPSRRTCSGRAYFWCWNGPLKPEVLRRQLADMAAHDARSVCVLPLPHEFRPDNTNNQMDVDYLSPQFFDRVKIAVDEAARLGMNYWLYDEGGWPSGQACGQVLRARPDTAVRVLAYDAKGKWSPRTEGMRRPVESADDEDLYRADARALCRRGGLPFRQDHQVHVHRRARVPVSRAGARHPLARRRGRRSFAAGLATTRWTNSMRCA